MGYLHGYDTEEQEIKHGWQAIQDMSHGDSVKAGWWTNPHTDESYTADEAHMQQFVVPQKIALIHSEVSEALEGARKGLQDDHLPDRTMLEVELADTIIRIGDLAGALGLDVAGAINDKLAYNRKRADHKLDNRAKEGGKTF